MSCESTCWALVAVRPVILASARLGLLAVAEGCATRWCFTWRRRPSRPTLYVNCSFCAVGLCSRNLRMQPGDTPAVWATARSDRAGFNVSSWFAICFLSLRVSGRPWWSSLQWQRREPPRLLHEGSVRQYDRALVALRPAGDVGRRSRSPYLS